MKLTRLLAASIVSISFLTTSTSAFACEHDSHSWSWFGWCNHHDDDHERDCDHHDSHDGHDCDHHDSHDGHDCDGGGHSGSGGNGHSTGGGGSTGSGGGGSVGPKG